MKGQVPFNCHALPDSYQPYGLDTEPERGAVKGAPLEMGVELSHEHRRLLCTEVVRIDFPR